MEHLPLLPTTINTVVEEVHSHDRRAETWIHLLFYFNTQYKDSIVYIEKTLTSSYRQDKAKKE